MECPNCDGHGAIGGVICWLCEGKRMVLCADCKPDDFREEPCMACFDEVQQRLNQDHFERMALEKLERGPHVH